MKRLSVSLVPILGRASIVSSAAGMMIRRFEARMDQHSSLQQHRDALFAL